MKKLFAAVLAGILTLTITACGTGRSTPLNLGTGGETGVYNSYGQALSKALKDDAGITITPLRTDGSKENIHGIGTGELQLGLVQSDVITYAWQGRRSFQGEGRNDSFRTVAGLYPEVVQLVTTDPEIEEVDDLRGKTVSIGASGSGVFFSAFDVLDAANLTLNDITPVYYDFAASAEALRSGEIDAAFFVAGTPTPAVTELFRNDTVYLVPINLFTRKRLLSACPFYEKTVIPADSYAGQTKPVETVGVTATLVASADVPEWDIYELTKSLFEGKDTLASLHGLGGELNLESASSLKAAPYHPGAVRYYREQGIDIK